MVNHAAGRVLQDTENMRDFSNRIQAEIRRQILKDDMYKG